MSRLDVKKYRYPRLFLSYRVTQIGHHLQLTSFSNNKNIETKVLKVDKHEDIDRKPDIFTY